MNAVKPKFSTVFVTALVIVFVVLLGAAVVLGRSAEPAGRTVVTVRLWDEQVAAAYRKSFDEFSREHPDIEVRVNVVAYSSYFNTLRTDVAGGGADDVFWLSNAYFAGYADNGRLLDVGRTLGPDAAERLGCLGGPAVHPQRRGVGRAPAHRCGHRRLLQRRSTRSRRGRRHGAVVAAMVPLGSAGGDTLRAVLSRLTLDADGNRAGTARFDPDRIRQYGYNAANDLQGIYLNYVGSAGGVFQDGDRFAFDNPSAVKAFEYVVRLINDDHVAPGASDTNGNGDFSRNQFLQGRMALFQSGTYNLAAIADQAPFHWGVAMLPTGPAGRVSVTNGIAAAGNSATPHPDAVRAVLAWMGSTRGNQYLGASGAAIPAVVAAQPVYHQYWAKRGVDVSPFFSVLDGPRIPAPGGPGFAAGYQAFTPYFDEMFLGRSNVASTLAAAQSAANAAADR